MSVEIDYPPFIEVFAMREHRRTIASLFPETRQWYNGEQSLKLQPPHCGWVSMHADLRFDPIGSKFVGDWWSAAYLEMQRRITSAGFHLHYVNFHAGGHYFFAHPQKGEIVYFSYADYPHVSQTDKPIPPKGVPFKSISTHPDDVAAFGNAWVGWCFVPED